MVKIAQFSQAGGHTENEDHHVVKPHPLDPDCMLCAVADGQGGQGGGTHASRIACETGIDTICRTSHREIAHTRCWVKALETADRAVEHDEEAGYATLVCLGIIKEHVIGASNGDSAALVIDHSGKPIVLTEHQKKNPPMGSGDAVATPFDHRLKAPWKVLVMTDGVWKYTGMEEVIRAASAKQGQEIINSLWETATEKGARRLQDDFTIVVLENE